MGGGLPHVRSICFVYHYCPWQSYPNIWNIFCIHFDCGCQFTSAAFKGYCHFLGCEHRMSNIQYQLSNGLAERYIKTIKTALTAKLDRNNWAKYIPLIVLSINTTYRADLKCSSAELVFTQTLRLPGDLCFNTPLPRIAFSYDFVLSMRKFANGCKPTDTGVGQSNPTHRPKDLETCTHVYVRNDPIEQNLTPIYDGPFVVHSRTNKTFKIFRKGNLSSVGINNIKPHLLYTMLHLNYLFVPQQFLPIPI